MSFSSEKTKCNLFYNEYTQKNDENPQNMSVFYLYKEEKIVFCQEAIKYLRYYLSYTLNKTHQINYIIKKATFSFRSLRKTFKDVKNLKIKTYFSIIKSSVFSILSHCDILLIKVSQTELKPLRIFHHKILRYLCGATKHTN